MSYDINADATLSTIDKLRSLLTLRIFGSPPQAEIIAEKCQRIVEGYEIEAGPILQRMGRGGNFPAVIMSQYAATLSHNLATTQGVDTVLEQARAAGASQVGEASERDWGGYSGYFADPDGFRWEVAYNPGEIGQSVLP